MKKNSCILIFIMTLLMGFHMNNINITKHLPVLLFKTNSTAFDTIQDYADEYKGMDSTAIILNVVNIIKSHPNLKMTIEGFYDSKETVKDLGLRRAEKVRNIFIQNGINDTIIKIVAKKGDYDGYTNKEVNSMSKVDREFMRRRNRIVVFNIEKW